MGGFWQDICRYMEINVAWNVDIELKSSRVHGKGVFAKEPIPAGTKVWQFDPAMRVCDRNSFAKLAPKTITFALHGGYLHVPSGKFLWYKDGMEFLNHGGPRRSNVGLDYWPALGDDHVVALRDIEAGEELLEDYGFCLEGGLAPDHWLHPFYMAHHRAHYDFLTEIMRSRQPRPSVWVEPYGLEKNPSTVDTRVSSISGLAKTASKPDARHAA